MTVAPSPADVNRRVFPRGGRRGRLRAMPIYEYRCESCAERFEELVRRPDDPVACPECGGSGRSACCPRSPGSAAAGARPAPDYSRLAHHTDHAGGCCGGGCGHMH